MITAKPLVLKYSEVVKLMKKLYPNDGPADWDRIWNQLPGTAEWRGATFVDDRPTTEANPEWGPVTP